MKHECHVCASGPAADDPGEGTVRGPHGLLCTECAAAGPCGCGCDVCDVCEGKVAIELPSGHGHRRVCLACFATGMYGQQE